MQLTHHIHRRTNLLLVRRLYVLALILLFNTPVFADTTCGNNPQAAELAELIRQHPQQTRKQLNCNEKLSHIAEFKVELLSQNDIIMHNIGHLTPNQLLRDNGYSLSSSYPILGNQVEAIAAGEKNATATFNQLLNSKIHRNLLLGNADFYLPQNEIGVAYLRQNNAPYEYYWVIYLADTNERPKPELQYTIGFNNPFSQESSKKDDKMRIRERFNNSRNTRPMMSTDY